MTSLISSVHLDFDLDCSLSLIAAEGAAGAAMLCGELENGFIAESKMGADR